MQIYLVGGAVRDELLGRPVVDRDWVVVGAEEEAMLARGLRRKDPEFPVFEDPDSGDEYALARRETKTRGGHRGFRMEAGPTVSLEEDLRRRDLTVNAMARTEDGRIVDPHGGQADLKARVLRHVTPAFVEDPLRLLRLARFHAQLGRHEFEIAPETEALARTMAEGQDLRTLSGPRIWAETRRALVGDRPSHFLQDLDRWGLVPILLGELAGETGAFPAPRLAALSALDACEDQPLDFTRLAALFAAGSDAAAARERARALATRFSLPRARRDLLAAAASPPPLAGDADAILDWLESMDGLRQPARPAFALAIQSALGQLSTALARTLREAAQAARVARPPAGTPPGRETMRQARLDAVRSRLASANGGEPRR